MTQPMTADQAGVQTYGAHNEGGKGYQPLKPLDELSPTQLIDLNDKWYKRCMANRIHVEREVLLSVAFYLGEHYVEALPFVNSARITAIPRRKGRVRTTDNQVLPIARSELARLTKSRPQGNTLPAGLDPEDYEAASAADDVILHVSRECEVESYVETAVLWSLFGGSALINCHWDAHAITRYGEPGDYLFRTLNVFEFGLPLLRKERLDDQPYLMVTRQTEIDEIYEQWHVVVPAEKAQAQQGGMEERLTQAITYNLGTPFGGGGASGGETDQPSAVVKETWIKPCRIAPAGAVLITANGMLLDMKPWPEWCNRRFPFGKIEFTRVPGSCYGQGLIYPLIPIQRRHNRALSISMEAMNLSAQIGISVPKGASTRKMLGGQGTLIEMPPSAMQGVTNIMPPQIGDLPFRELEQTREAFRSISFQHQQTQGINPPGVRSGTQIELLKEYDDSASTTTQRTIERTVERIGNIILDIAKLEWDDERLITVLSVEGDIERRSFLAKGAVENAGQYVVQSGSAWPHSRAERQNLIMQLSTTPTADGKPFITSDEALSLLDMGGLRKAVADRDMDKRQARRENQLFQEWGPTQDPTTGQTVLPAPPEPRDWEAHATHIEVHNQLRKSPHYLTYSPTKQKIIDAHIAGHIMALREQQAEIMSAQSSPPPSAQMRQQQQL